MYHHISINNSHCPLSANPFTLRVSWDASKMCKAILLGKVFELVHCILWVMGDVHDSGTL